MTPTTPNPHPHSLMWKVFTIANVVLKAITNNMSIGVLPKVESIYFWQLHYVYQLFLFSVTSTTGPMDPNLDLLAKHQKLDLLIERLELVTKRLENVASFAAKSQGKQILKSRCSKAEVPR